MSFRSAVFLLVFAFLPCAAAQSLPPAVNRTVDFSKDVHPLLVSRCAGCHTGDEPQAGLRMNTRAEMLKGGVNGPAIVPGASQDSLLIQRVAGTKPPIMPMVGDRLTNEEIGILRAWIDQGAMVSQETAAGTWKPILHPRLPELPEGATESPNPLDAFLAVYFKQNRVQATTVVADSVFARRVYMDLWGVPPSPAERAAFLGDTDPHKRARLVKTLLANRQHFSENWISFWNDLLHNDEGVTYIGDRKSITPWLLDALRQNLPYDRMVQALLNPVKPDGPEGFLMGVNWRGDINASQTPVMQAAQNSSQVFLGVNLKCNSCHDSFISNWKLKDAYGMASFFSEQPLELVRCDAKTGEMSSPKFLFEELGSVPADAPLSKRLAVAAELFTKRENGRFTRTFVNRIWKKLMGRGIVEPVDDMDAQPFDADLLDWLAYEFAGHNYDIDWLLTQIMTSRAYQLPGVSQGESPEKPYVFRGPQYRRLTAEQFADSISAITGEWRVLGSTKPEPGIYSREWRFKAGALTRALGRPTRDLAVTERTNDPTTLQLLELVNGRTLSETIRRASLRMLDELPAAPESLFDSGVVASNMVPIDIDISGARELRLVLVDHDSYDVTRVVAGWAAASLEGPAGSQALTELPMGNSARKGSLEFRGAAGPQDALIAKVPSELVFNIAGKGYTRFRAVAGADKASLASDINPRIRFYVFTSKPDYERLGRVTGNTPLPYVPEKFTADSLVSRIFLHALSREPSPEERKVAGEYLRGSRGRIPAEGLEDLLWSVFLSPEFQFLN